MCLALCTTSAEAVWGGQWTEPCPEVATELFHVCTHMHDDVMDGDERRRGRQSIWKTLGVSQADLDRVSPPAHAELGALAKFILHRHG